MSPILSHLVIVIILLCIISLGTNVNSMSAQVWTGFAPFNYTTAQTIGECWPQPRAFYGHFQCNEHHRHCACANDTMVAPGVTCTEGSLINGGGCGLVACDTEHNQSLNYKNFADPDSNLCCPEFTCLDNSNMTMDTCYPGPDSSLKVRPSMKTTCDGGKTFFCTCTGLDFIIPPALFADGCFDAYVVEECGVTPNCSEHEVLLLSQPADPRNGICCDRYKCSVVIPNNNTDDNNTTSNNNTINNSSNSNNTADNNSNNNINTNNGTNNTDDNNNNNNNTNITDTTNNGTNNTDDNNNNTNITDITNNNTINNNTDSNNTIVNSENSNVNGLNQTASKISTTLSPAVVDGIIIGVIAGVAVMIAIIIITVYKVRQSRQQAHQEGEQYIQTIPKQVKDN